ncbi:MAG: protein-export chaperone SecB [Desulfuromonadales bacterium]|nr:protein-export chaperone SecB [Desulfuromonadales bacterium]
MTIETQLLSPLISRLLKLIAVNWSLSMHALLELDEYFVDKFFFAANESYDGKDRHEASIDVDFAVTRSSDGQPRFEVRLFVEVNNKEDFFSKAPYRMDFRVTVYFHFPEGTDENDINKLIVPNGLSILYGVARDIVSRQTEVGRFGRFMQHR